LGGRVAAIPKLTTDGVPQRIPHIGWNHLQTPMNNRDWAGSLLDEFQNMQPAVYFVHSFAAMPTDDSIRLADTLYGGHRLCAAVQSKNIMATQFHPERSGEIGLKIIRAFIRT
jgi:glutamine amidotransferase